MSLNVSLTPELQAFIKKKLHDGGYKSASEVVRESLRLLQERDDLNAAKLQALREDIPAGLASGPSRPLDVKKIKAEGRKKLRSN